jgi:hypothetical protein
MNEQLIVKAVNKLRPNSEFSFTDADYSNIKWIKLEGVAPTAAEIEAVIKSLKDEEEFLAAQRALDKADLLERLGITADEAALLLS